MNWKERLTVFLTTKKPWTKHRAVDFEYFISTEIIEKLIAEFQRMVSDGHCSLNPELKQLRDKWL